MRKKLKKRLKKRDEENSISNARIEPTFEDEPSTKPGSIRIISVAEYKKQIEVAKKIDADSANLQRQNGAVSQDQDDTYQRNRSYKSAWKKILSSTIGIVLVGINVALIYFEIQPKIIKPTFSVATPWGVAEVLTPWGTDEKKIAQLNLRKMPSIKKENSIGNAEVTLNKNNE